MAYKEPTFQDRAALAAQAKQKALEKLKAKPQIDPAVAAARAAARQAREEKEVQRRAEKAQAIEQARLDKIAKAEAELAAIEAEKQRLIDADIAAKAARDARYAARKAKR
jgi:hypothetical protein